MIFYINYIDALKPGSKKKLDNESTHNGSVQTCTEYKNSRSLELIVDGLSMDSYLIET